MKDEEIIGKHCNDWLECSLTESRKREIGENTDLKQKRKVNIKQNKILEINSNVSVIPINENTLNSPEILILDLKYPAICSLQKNTNI